MSIYDAAGRLVRQWDYPTIRLSDHVTWNETDDQGRKLPEGIYFVQFTIGTIFLQRYFINSNF